ncbi:LANO_0F10550g1_1 [Lachancea nothofagi CBS 11611]|uniref:RING-type E3 ubiquitin transferase n=1 Tax=Lachancea nothofagi CBS 11611 TaxID=1266666 RepID=A0A1G4KAG0_9SACH|nr:LANO_0F10550g1_1 [Lachancea nothofagi CBS 11611]
MNDMDFLSSVMPNPPMDSTIPNGATCRICRGEHTDETPLFHPCKCRGSIKYIHEGCLMEWVASKNVDLTRPGSEIKCDICHHRIQLTTVYDDNTPDRVPLALILRTTFSVVLRKAQYTLCIAVAASLLIVGIPLVWNILGKFIAMLLFKGTLTVSGHFWKSVLFGFESTVPEKATKLDVTLQLLKNYRFSVSQIVLVAVIHIALYFQYDMVVREAIFNKMVYHKIGPRYSKEELMTEKLKQQFPSMDENTIHHIVQLMRARERPDVDQEAPVVDANAAEGHRGDNEDAHEPRHGRRNTDDDGSSSSNNNNNNGSNNNNNNNTNYNDNFDNDNDDHNNETSLNNANPLNAGGALFRHGANARTTRSGVQPLSNELPPAYDAIGDNSNGLESFNGRENRNSEEDDEDQDYDPNDTSLSQSSNSSVGSSNHDINDEERDLLMEDADPVGIFRHRRAVNELDDILQAQQENAPGGQADEFVFMDVPNDAAGAVDQADMNDVLNQQDGPAVLGLHLRFMNMPFYFLAAIVFLALYLYLAYAIPTFVGNLLLQAYGSAISYTIRGIFKLASIIKLPLLFSEIARVFPSSATFFSSSMSQAFDYCAYLHSNYLDFQNKASTVAQSVPALTTYCTFLGLISASTSFICKGFGVKNGMKNPSMRFVFQLFFAIRCSLKVFLLFAVELVGFPVLAGLMIDFSLISPCLQAHKHLLCVGTLDIWAPTIWVLYWGIGTSYMFWFAKYVGMIRNFIIRPGVLFFIRSSDDPNIRILHDSLIHPMRIQFSRLVLSMAIYAMFIVVGFGFHTRVLFPVILKSKLLPFADEDSFFFCLIGLLMLNSNLLMDFNKTFRVYVRQYWTKVFDISCEKLRLSSFMLDKDIPTERGYVIYRNIFYKLLLSKKAKWSNPELYVDPKTPKQAEELFKVQRDVHAYFIPNGVLMRVPANDIISRNYVQTLFVPITKDNKLLKPLDVEAIKERNRESVGEFSHLDDQSTEFDAYTRVYTPPNFRLRYSTLIVLIWLFASLLSISLVLMFNFVGRITLLGILSPLLKLDFAQSLFGMYQNLTAIGLFPMVVGASVSMIGLEVYQELLIARFIHGEHVVDPQEDEDAPERDIDEAGILPARNVANDQAARPEPLWERFVWQQKNVLSCLIGAVGATKFIFVLDYNYSTVAMFFKLMFSHGDPIETRHRLFLAATTNDTVSAFTQWESKEMLIFASWFLLSLFMDQKCFFSSLIRERQDDTVRQLKLQLKGLVKECLTTAGLILPLQLMVCIFEYAFNGSRYDSIYAVFSFLMNSRGLVPESDVPWTILQRLFYIVSPVVCGKYYLTGLFQNLYAFMQKSAAITKEEIYGRGRTLTNLFDENEL